jgi:hypothetical protein
MAPRYADLAMRIVEVVVVYDVACPPCSAIARELPELMRVPVTVRSCRDRHLPADVPAQVRACARPALGVVRPDGTTRWWPGVTGALAVLPAVRPGRLREAATLLATTLRRRAAR